MYYYNVCAFHDGRWASARLPLRSPRHVLTVPGDETAAVRDAQARKDAQQLPHTAGPVEELAGRYVLGADQAGPGAGKVREGRRKGGEKGL
jgi:hypothetical protein